MRVESESLSQPTQAFGIESKPNNKQIPWKLMRKLRQKDVEENKKRIEKKMQDKIEKMGKKFH